MANTIFTFSTAIYFMINPNEGLPRYGLTGAYGTIMVAVSLILMIPYFIALKQSYKYQIISGKAYQSRPVALGRWWLGAWGLLGLYFMLAFVLPLLGYFGSRSCLTCKPRHGKPCRRLPLNAIRPRLSIARPWGRRATRFY